MRDGIQEEGSESNILYGVADQCGREKMNHFLAHALKRGSNCEASVSLT